MIWSLFCDLKFISKGPEIEDSRTPKKIKVVSKQVQDDVLKQVQDDVLKQVEDDGLFE